MIKPVHPVALLLALCAQWASAQGQTVYRCGESYSTQPCPGGTIVPTDDPRSAAQRLQTDAATKRDARDAQVLENERLKQEGKPAQATIPAAAPQPAPVVKNLAAPRSKLKKPELFTAVSPKKPDDGQPKKKKKKKATKKAAA